MDQNYVKIFDTTLRDGEQSPGNSMNLQEKERLAQQLERLGIDVMEAGFPIASPDDFQAVQEISKVCSKTEVCGLARTLEKDIRCAWDALKHAVKPRIHTFIATSPIHMEHKLRKTPQQVLQMAIDGVTLAKSLCDRVDFSPEDASRSERNFLYQVIEAAIHAGADTINIPDTVGYSTPEEFKGLIADLIANVPNSKGIIFSTHCHNDLGLAVANSLAGVRGGARQIECTINGIGERAGNAALEECVMALNTRKDYYTLYTGIDTKELFPTSRLLSSITGNTVQSNKAIVGANAFAHEAGIHQDGVLKNRETYEIMRAEDVGMDSNTLVLGKHSGRHALKDRVESLGHTLTDETLNELYEKFIILADKKKQIFDADILLLLDNKEDAEAFSLIRVRAVACTDTMPEAEVVLSDINGNQYCETAHGDGPIDSAYTAISKITGLECTLQEFHIHSATEGTDAQATVAVQIQTKEGNIVSGTGSGTDIIVAAVRAYLQAMNKEIQSSP